MSEFTGKPAASSQEINLRRNLDTLIAQREALEIEADAIGSELKSPGPNGEPPAGIKDSLIDSEGYPRGDIDIYNVKNKRKRLSEINVDYKILMKQIETTMLTLYQSFPSDNRDSANAISKSHDPSTTTVVASDTATQSAPTITSRAIAKLDQILVSSPAWTAGIQEGDELLQFGAVSSATPDFLKRIAKLVGESLNQQVPLLLRRTNATTKDPELVQLSITPASWGGRGLLGCHLSPVV